MLCWNYTTKYTNPANQHPWLLQAKLAQLDFSKNLNRFIFWLQNRNTLRFHKVWNLTRNNRKNTTVQILKRPPLRRGLNTRPEMYFFRFVAWLYQYTFILHCWAKLLDSNKSSFPVGIELPCLKLGKTSLPRVATQQSAFLECWDDFPSYCWHARLVFLELEPNNFASWNLGVTPTF